MATQAERPMKKGDLDDKFEVLAENEDGWGIIQFDGPNRFVIYTGRKSRTGRFYRASVPREDFPELAKVALVALEKAENR